MTRTYEDKARSEAKAAWSVVVVHEGSAARERAVAFCDQLVARFWAQFEFDVSWWAFDSLGQTAPANDAAGKAVRADVVVISTAPEGDFPGPVKAWLESWLGQRGDREGLLIGLMGPGPAPSGREGQKHNYLRNAAHRGAMDYLTEAPQDIVRPIPDSLDSYSQRADQVTHLLDDILHQQTPPPPEVLR